MADKRCVRRETRRFIRENMREWRDYWTSAVSALTPIIITIGIGVGVVIAMVASTWAFLSYPIPMTVLSIALAASVLAVSVYMNARRKAIDYCNAQAGTQAKGNP